MKKDKEEDKCEKENIIYYGSINYYNTTINKIINKC